MATIKCSVTKSSWYEMYIEYSIKGDTAKKQSTVSHALKLKQLTNTYDFNGMMNVTYYVNGTAYSFNDNVDIAYKGDKGYTITIKSGETTISHDANGDASFKVSCSGSCNSGGWGPGTISLAETTVKCPRLPIFKLSISAGTGSNITVNRTSSGGSGGTGTLSSGDNKLYYGDKLKISFSASTNYAVGTHTVNGSSFTSGNTHTVSGDVSVIATAIPLISSISATDADIESVSAIMVTRYNSTYTHTITYTFRGESGVIATNSSETMIPWTIPDTFYAQIPDAPSGVCKISCETLNDNISLGVSSCEIIVTASPDRCAPEASVAMFDDNDITTILTGNRAYSVRFKSNVVCGLAAMPKNSASISSMSVDGNQIQFSAPQQNGVVSAERYHCDASKAQYTIVVTDSRGYTWTKVVPLPSVPYINLTCNPVLSRPAPTSESIVMSVTGDMFIGSFGNCENNLIMRYRYRESDGAFGDLGGWLTIDEEHFVYIDGETGSYRFKTDVELTPYDAAEGFDYNKSYVFEISATDGGVVDGVRYDLSTVTRTVSVARGIPVFDWGENDFNVNVPLMLKNVNILNIIYPVGTVYMHSDSTLPDVVGEIGTWASISSGINGVYAWKRTA